MWTPHPGPQTEFLASTETEVLYGGAAGGGKSDSLLVAGLIPLQVPTGRSLFLRRSFPELREMIDRAKLMFAPAGAVWNSTDKRFTFPNGAVYEFGYAATYAEVLQYQGQEYARILYDELGLLTEERALEFLLSRLRVKDPRLTPRFLASANPGGPGHAWIMERYVRPTEYGASVYVTANGMTRRFIPAKASDNPTLLQNSPDYLQRLADLPEIMRKQLLEGDWDAAAGMYFGKLQREPHVIPHFRVPSSWAKWGAFDWGYAHPAAFGKFAADHEGNMYLVDSVSMHRKTDHEQAERIIELCTLPDGTVEREYLSEVHSGHDSWDEVRARGSKVPSTVETFYEHQINLTKANISRIPGWRNLREYIEPRGPEKTPRFFILDTPANQAVYDNLKSLVSDERDPEDVRKVDADPQTGKGGDDSADMVRYGAAARVYVPAAPIDIHASMDDGRDTTPERVIYGHDRHDDNLTIAGLPAGF